MPLALLKYGLRKDYPVWRQFPTRPDLKPKYDIVIIGGGGHGLSAAYNLARYHGITNVAVLDKGYLGGGNTARNTAIIRSNYLTPKRACDSMPNPWSLFQGTERASSGSTSSIPSAAT